MAPFREGMRVRSRFRLVEPLGTGGMSQVWRARDEVLNRDVALKLLIAPGAGDPAPRSATVREARLAATTTHPNLTQVYDCGETVLPDGTQVPYLVMELVDGETLADRLAAGPLPWPEVARVGGDVARALATAHRAGVVHRDVKPANVVLTPTGAKLLDFGIAARSGSRAERGRLVGTPTYAAPERIDADVARPEGDVYSLGVLCYEALTGRPPLELPSWEHARDARRRSRRDRDAAGTAAADLTARLPEVPEPLARLCLACLSLDPAGRPDADRLAGELSAIAGGQAVEERARPYAVGTAAPPLPPTTPERDRPRTGRGRRVALAAATLLTVLAVALSAALLWPGVFARWLGVRSATGVDVVAAAPEATSRAPTDPYGALIALDQTISRALATGAVDRATARDLRERIDEVHTELERRDPGERSHKVRGKATELRTEIQRHARGGDITPAVADRLTTQLAPLTGD